MPAPQTQVDTPATRISAAELPGLTSLRGLAASAVVLGTAAVIGIAPSGTDRRTLRKPCNPNEGWGARVRALREFGGILVCRACQADHCSFFWQSDAMFLGVAGAIVLCYAGSVLDGLLVILFPSLPAGRRRQWRLYGWLLEVAPLRALADMAYLRNYNV